MDTDRFRKKAEFIPTPRSAPRPQLDSQGFTNIQSPKSEAINDQQIASQRPPDAQRLQTASMRPTEVVLPPRVSNIQRSVQPNTAEPSLQPQTAPAAASISVQISIPKLHIHRPKLPRLPYRRIGLWSAIILLGLVAIVGGYLLVRHFFFHPKPLVSFSQGIAAAALTKPTFTPVAPRDKPGLAADQAGSTAFDGKHDVYSYSDEIDGTTFVVSQEPTPSMFDSADQAVSYIAKSMGAAKFTTAGIPAYIATNPKTKTQSIVFTVQGLLLFIQSNFIHGNAEWQNYIDNIQ